jgi:hypothetical protein
MGKEKRESWQVLVVASSINAKSDAE